MTFVLSVHAKEQIARRGIDLETITEIVSKPDFVTEQDKGIMVFNKYFPDQHKNFLYRVFVNMEKIPPLVITAYKTSKTDKYEDKI